MIAYLEKYDTTVDVPDDIGQKGLQDVNDNFHSYVDKPTSTPTQQAPAPQAISPSPTAQSAPAPEATPQGPEQNKWLPNFYESAIKPALATLTAPATTLAKATESPEAQAFGGSYLEAQTVEGAKPLVEPLMGQAIKDHPAYAIAGTITGGIGSIVAAGALATALGAGELGAVMGKAAEPLWAAGERFIPRGIMGAATFGTRAFIAETVKAFEHGGVNLEEFGRDVLAETAFGTGVGLTGGIPNMLGRIASAAGLGFISSKLEGGDNREATLHSAIWGFAEGIFGIGQTEKLRLEALGNFKETLADYVQGRDPGVPEGQARTIANNFVDNAMKKAGYPTAEAIAKSGPENLLEGIEKVNQMFRNAKIENPMAQAQALPKLPAPVEPAATGAAPAPAEPPKSPLEKVVSAAKEMLGMKEEPKEPPAATAPIQTNKSKIAEISDRLDIHGISEPEKEAIFGKYTGAGIVPKPGTPNLLDVKESNLATEPALRFTFQGPVSREQMTDFVKSAYPNQKIGIDMSKSHPSIGQYSVKFYGPESEVQGVPPDWKQKLFGAPNLLHAPIDQQYQEVYKTLADQRGIDKGDKYDSKTMDDAQKAVDLINGYFNPKSQYLMEFAKAHPEASTGDVAQMAYNRDLIEHPSEDLMMNELEKAKQEKIATHVKPTPREEHDWDKNISSYEETGKPGFAQEKISGWRSIANQGLHFAYRDEQGKVQGTLDVNRDYPGVDKNGTFEIGVNPEFRRKGIASKLMDLAESKGVNFAELQKESAFTKEGTALFNSRLSSESGAVMIPPDLVDVANHIRESSEEIRNIVAPANAAPLAAQITREKLGQMARSYDVAEASLSNASKVFEKQSKDANIDFIDKMERGQPQQDPKLQPLAIQLRDLLDSKRAEIQALGTGKLKAFNENYFPHIWDQGEKQIGQAAQKASKRPFEGSKAFLKARIIEFTKEGVEAGLTPVSYNPVDLALLKMREMDKYITTHQTIKEFKENGLAQFVRVGGDVPEGWKEIDDRISTVMFKGEEGLTIAGHIYAQPDAARIINNYLSPGLQSSKLFQAYRYAGNAMNQFQLGFSAFHLGFTSLEASVSKLSLAINELAHGNPLSAIKNAIATPFAPISTIIRGNQMLKAWRGQGQNGVDNILAEAMASGGGRARMDQFYATKAYEQMKHHFQVGNVVQGLLHIPLAIADAASKPILEYAVPRTKLGAFADIMQMELNNHPDISHQELRQLAQRAWDSVDNRFGQLVYDNLFWNRTFKDILMGSQRSVGWNLGTIREIGGGGLDYIEQLTKPLTGKKPEMTLKMAHFIALPMLVGMLGAIMQYLRTGKGPQELKDYYFPKAGGIDANGDAHRISLPSYMKDVYHYTQDPIQTLSNKTAPLISSISQMLENKDYYGTKIRNEDDPIAKQVKSEVEFMLKQMTPFSIRNMQKNLETSNKSLFDTVGPWVGITPAPYDIDQSKAEKLAHNIAMSHQEIGGRTEEQVQRSKLLNELTRQYKMGDPNATKNLYQAYQEGMISHRQMQEVIVHSTMTPLQRMVKGMSLQEAERVYDKSTDEEKSQLESMIERKRMSHEKEYVTQ